ncbi:hypothetical protein PAXRUDRAFT_7800 [Paxillus rubicundulus Ve08.2h10]|uniref:Uncharacterized protein n=1 Tax=Paxillus rubicundulus Ve08.2h10 TaxID=930991 RepID=A0A0D0EDF5_9AGAM|nr:hypothetical protein PAXRUDRAFT_7800 [Paxillus rubicundulus Ve08.2h10]
MVLKSDTPSTRKREGWNHRNRSSQSDINISFQALKHSSTQSASEKTRSSERNENGMRGEGRRSHGGVTKRLKQLCGLALASLSSALSTETGEANLHRNPNLIELKDADPVQEAAAG